MGKSIKFLSLFFITRCLVVAASGSPSDDALVDWLKKDAVPVTSLDAIDQGDDLSYFLGFAGRAKVVGLGESAHAIHDFNQARLHFLNYLVKNRGFRALVIESGILEGRLVEDYVQNRSSLTLDQVLDAGFTHRMGDFEESKALVTWIKEYNQKQLNDADKVHFIGMDLSVTGDSPSLPLGLLDDYVRQYAPNDVYTLSFMPVLSLAQKADALTLKVAQLYRTKGTIIEPDLLDGFTTLSFERLSDEKQRLLAKGIVGIEKYLKRERKILLRASGAEAYAWNLRLATVAGQMVRDLRNRRVYPKITGFDQCLALLKQHLPQELATLTIDARHLLTAPTPLVSDYLDYFQGRESRELSEAENVRWAQQQYGKVFVYAQNGHLQKNSKDILVGSLHIGHPQGKVEGQFLARWYKRDYVLLGSTLNNLVAPPVPVIPTSFCIDCLEQPLVEAAKELGPIFFVDFRDASGKAKRALNRERQNRFDVAGFQRFNPYQAFDGILFVDSATMETPLKNTTREEN